MSTGTVRLYRDSFDDPNLPGETQTIITMKQVSCRQHVG